MATDLTIDPCGPLYSVWLAFLLSLSLSKGNETRLHSGDSTILVGAMLKGLLRGEILTRWVLLSATPIRTWLPFPRCIDKYCPAGNAYLLHAWAWTIKGKKPSTWLEWRDDIPMRINQTYRGEAVDVTITMPSPKVHVERPWGVARFRMFNYVGLDQLI